MNVESLSLLVQCEGCFNTFIPLLTHKEVDIPAHPARVCPHKCALFKEMSHHTDKSGLKTKSSSNASAAPYTMALIRSYQMLLYYTKLMSVNNTIYSLLQQRILKYHIRTIYFHVLAIINSLINKDIRSMNVYPEPLSSLLKAKLHIP